MGKFGITARVADAEGDVGEIVDKRKGERLVRYDNVGLAVAWLPKGGLSLTNDNVAPWVPKVGDRVRYKHDREEVPVTEVLDDGRVKVRTAHWGICTESTSSLEPVTLTIEAGKFYRTRDGRKVGPIGWSGDSKWPFDGSGEGISSSAYFDVDGTCPHLPHNNLVAEWVGPAVQVGHDTKFFVDGVPVAVAEATATPLKVKVGDRVRRIQSDVPAVCPVGFETSITDVVGDIIWYVDVDGDEISSSAGHISWELVTPAAPPAKFKVGDRVDLYRDGKPVETWRNMTITEVDRGDVFEFNTDVGLLCNARELLPSTPTPGSTVTFTATGRLSAINENGHYQVTFPGLPAGRNSFALPADYVSLAN